jgi:hypothetical protein
MRDMTELTENLTEDCYTDDVYDAIYIFADGTMIGADMSYGNRNVDHNILLGAIEGGIMPEELLRAYNIVLLVPEDLIAYYSNAVGLTSEQHALLDNSKYTVKVYE